MSNTSMGRGLRTISIAQLASRSQLEFYPEVEFGTNINEQKWVDTGNTYIYFPPNIEYGILTPEEVDNLIQTLQERREEIGNRGKMAGA